MSTKSRKQKIIIAGTIIITVLGILAFLLARGCDDDAESTQADQTTVDRTALVVTEPEPVPAVDPEPEPVPEPLPTVASQPEQVTYTEPQTGGQRPQLAPPASVLQLINYVSPSCDAFPLLDAVGTGCPFSSMVSLSVQATTDIVTVNVEVSGTGYASTFIFPMANGGPHQPGGNNDWYIHLNSPGYPPATPGTYYYAFIGHDSHGAVVVEPGGSFQITP